MTQKSKTELEVDLSCRCGFVKRIKIDLDEDGVYTIPNKYCPNDFRGLSRDIVPILINEPIVESENEPTEDKTATPNPVSRLTRVLERPKNGAYSSKTS